MLFYIRIRSEINVVMFYIILICVSYFMSFAKDLILAVHFMFILG